MVSSTRAFDVKTVMASAIMLTTSACTSLPTLVKEQRYPEAICKTYDASQKDLEAAAPQLAMLGHARWRLREILPDLTGVEDPAATQFFASHVIVVVETQADPIAGLQPLFPEPGARSEGQPLSPSLQVSDALQIYDMGFVAQLTGETVPMPRQVITHIDWGAVLVAAATAGFSLPFVPLDLQTKTVYPTPQEIAAAVPHAIAITRVLQSADFPRIGWWFAMEKKGDDAAHLQLSISLQSTHASWGNDAECFKQLVVFFKPVDVALHANQEWPAGRDFRRFEWSSLMKLDATGRTDTGVVNH